MALKDLVPFGMSLPHRSPDRIGMDVVRAVATRADALGFRDLWVTDNTLDHVTSFDPVVVLTYAAAVTSRIGLGASVLVLPVHDPRHNQRINGPVSTISVTAERSWVSGSAGRFTSRNSRSPRTAASLGFVSRST